VKQCGIAEKPLKALYLQELIGYSSFCFTEKTSWCESTDSRPAAKRAFP
jgi:hypothetical protein